MQGGVVIIIGDGCHFYFQLDFGHVVGNIAPSLVESLGEFLICRFTGGVWAVVDGPTM